MAWSRPPGPQWPQRPGDQKTWGRLSGPSLVRPLARLAAARGFPGRRRRRPHDTPAVPHQGARHNHHFSAPRSNGSYTCLQHQPRVGLMVRVPLPPGPDSCQPALSDPPSSSCTCAPCPLVPSLVHLACSVLRYTCARPISHCEGPSWSPLRLPDPRRQRRQPSQRDALACGWAATRFTPDPKLGTPARRNVSICTPKVLKGQHT